MFNSRKADAISGFLNDPPKQTHAAKEGSRDFLEYNGKKISHSGPLVHGTVFGKSGKEHDDLHMVSSRANLSKLSGLVATRTLASEDHREKPGPLTLEAVNQVGRSQRSFNELESAGKQNVRRHMPKTAESPQTGGGRACIKESSLVSFLVLFFILNGGHRYKSVQHIKPTFIIDNNIYFGRSHCIIN